MCKKHKKKIHLRQICGFHLNLFMALSPRQQSVRKSMYLFEWVTIWPHFPAPVTAGKGFRLRPRPFLLVCGRKKWAGPWYS